jgi:hypothetical protein
MIILPYAAAAIIALLGILHLAYTLHDFMTAPKYFAPTNPQTLQAMKSAHTAIAPQGRDYWSGVLGFNLSHSLGLLLFALLVVVTAAQDIIWLKPVTVLFGAAYGMISYRCWFIAPTIGVSFATGLMMLGWWL